MTETVYIPNWPPTSARSFISTIFPAIRNIIPTGAYLSSKVIHEKYDRATRKALNFFFNLSLFEENMLGCFSYHMMMATNLMMASFKQSKKFLRAWPCCFMLPMTRPKHMEKTTRPRAFTPPEEPATGTVSSTVSFAENQSSTQVPMSLSVELRAEQSAKQAISLPAWCATLCWSSPAGHTPSHWESRWNSESLSRFWCRQSSYTQFYTTKNTVKSTHDSGLE